MERPITSLWWSGVAAGLSISFSLLAQAILQTHLPDAPWRPLISSFGYSAGFLMAILSRQQLFTESTITAVLPVMDDLSVANCWRISRTWGIVLEARYGGYIPRRGILHFYAGFNAGAEDRNAAVTSPPKSRGTRSRGSAFSGHRLGLSDGHHWSRFIPSAGPTQFSRDHPHYLPDLGRRVHAHDVTGRRGSLSSGSERASRTLAGLVTEFFIPVLIGNIVGGTALFAMIAYAQVMNEI